MVTVPYINRRYMAWSCMEEDDCLSDTGYCLDAPSELPAGSWDSAEDLPAPTYIEREATSG